MKIGVYQYNDRYTLRFTAGDYELSFRFRDGEGIENISTIREFADSEFCEQVALMLREQHRLKLRQLSKQMPGVTEAFPEII